ncbi:acyl-CoA dehydrogenase [Marinitenerispora sediminis]|uniref:Broad-specificity linear acyl-CoA dehydrogenase FadE5 n=1 Tax=Marinitenerispora sediminis TaxID=1931232 RepID=A0A368TAP9_9ACTN|nr:acyl-CoA dehydrogenase [Marinitenerispora sediminis]RCV50801.1 acyl-CoA dehydrogenase [Marinitenerispora sediminis]RCV55023.1 acyl-CoA dehydrogenase [Marinitenerispora sediminis]RCV62061.1 acyl-CoA dehydrogenase [Marinitenerispora sediminis]
MTHYKSNLRDLEFNLFEVFTRQDVLGTGPFEELDEDTARTILEEVERLATGVIAESFEDSDRHPPVFDPQTNTVAIPESLKRSFHAYMDAGWYQLDLPRELGGVGAPRSLVWAASELVLGANPAVHMYAGGPGFANILWQEGNEWQRWFAEQAIERGWGATMVLTEPDAGSDVGAGRTRAVQQEDGTWHIEGVKRFITSGEQDMTENIFHLVLARPEGAGPGTKGLSLFLVPKFLVNEDGTLGERNGAYVTNVEHKMGLKASTTCELTFGARHPAVGYLVGDRHDGIRQMFRVIEYARMMVGTKAIATLSTGYLNALAYAKERVQGADLTRQADKTAPRVTITHHPDVRRSLMYQKAYAEGLRALVVYTATQQDAVQIARHRGEDAAEAEALNDLLLPLVKGVGSERSYALLAESLQTLGGSGYLQDYPIEQYIRDAKIDTLYEGTTAIQAQDLFFRKIVKNNGQALGRLMTEIGAFAAGDAGNGQLKSERAALAEAAADVQAIVESMVGDALRSAEEPRELYKVGLNTTRLLLALGDLVLAWLLLRQAEVALARLDGASGADRDFYTGKVAAARFFTDQVLPRLSAERVVAQRVTLDLMELPESAF